jgi:selenocysteine lyase/cysteine desulfurase
MTAETFRAQFPVFAQRIHAASCSQGALSHEVAHAVTTMLDHLSLDPAPWDGWMEIVEEARSRLAALLHTTPETIALFPNASIAAFQVITAWHHHAPSPTTIVSSNLEFPSIAQMYGNLQSVGLSLTLATLPLDTWDSEVIFQHLPETTGIVSLPLVAYQSGLTLPIAEVTTEVHHRGLPLLVDAYQGLGVVPLDVGELPVDFVVGGTLKYLLGLPGLGFAYIRPDHLSRLAPLLTGWFGRVNPFAFDPRLRDFPEQARRLETGTPAIPAAVAAAAGLRTLMEIPEAERWASVRSLALQLTQLLQDADVPLLSPIEERFLGPMVVVEAEQPAAMARFLAQRGIVTAPRGSGVRLSLHYYNTFEDVETIAREVKTWQTRMPSP